MHSCPHHASPTNAPRCSLQAMCEVCLDALQTIHAHTRDLLSSTVPRHLGAAVVVWDHADPQHIALSVDGPEGTTPAEVLQRLETITARVRQQVESGAAAGM